MLRRFSVNFAILSMALDMALTFLALIIAVFIGQWLPAPPFEEIAASFTLPQWIYFGIPLLWGLTFLVASVYDPKRIYKAADEFQIVAVATAVAGLTFAGILYLTLQQFPRSLFVTFLVLDLSLLIGWRIIARYIFKIGRLARPNRRVLIVGAGDVGRRVGQMIQDYHWMGLDLSGYLDRDAQDDHVTVLGRVEDVRHVVMVEQVDDVVVALPQQNYGQINELVLALHGLPVNVRFVPDYFSLTLYRASVEEFGGLPMINLRNPALNDVQRLLKRLFDLAIAVPMTVLLTPLIVIIALLIKLDSRGPVIFRQQRVGENGCLFDMYKFRSMIVGAEKLQDTVSETDAAGNVIYKKAGDPRVTRIGRLLRRTSLDELPQLLNVVKGDMSLVGPRPELPLLVGQYEPWQHKRFAVPQGMTGWWQINGRADKPLHLYTEDDIYYIQNYSLWMDIYILLKTPLVVMRGKGAY